MDGEVLEEINKITMHKEYYVNLTVYGVLSWCNISSCALDSK